jgi:hypothetical protein
MADPEAPPVIVPEATAKRRLAIYTGIRLAGLAALFGAVVLAQRGIGVVSVVLLMLGAGSLFVRPKLLARVFGARW